MVKYSPKDFEIYIAKSNGSFNPSTLGNNESLGAYFDSEVGTSLSDFAKLVDTNSISVDPAEDDTATKLYIGSTSSGAQNSETSVTLNPDVDITINADPSIIEQLTPYALAQSAATHTDFANYARFSLGNSSSDEIVLLIRVVKQVGSTYYYKNWVFVNPLFKKPDSLDISGDDETAGAEYSLTGNKSYTDKDFYSGATAETVTSLDQ
jgi:hypothetical protein